MRNVSDLFFYCRRFYFKRSGFLNLTVVGHSQRSSEHRVFVSPGGFSTDVRSSLKELPGS